MNLNDRFAVAEDDTSGIYDCMTCGALVRFDRLQDHNSWHEWHEEFDKKEPDPDDWGGGMTLSEHASLRDKS